MAPSYAAFSTRIGVYFQSEAIAALADEIAAESAALGLSRNEFLRRKLEGEAAARPRIAVTNEDWQRSADLFSDLADPNVMGDAWR